MTDTTETAATLADITGPTVDIGGGSYEQFIGADAPEHDPFADYPADAELEPPIAHGLMAVAATVSAALAHNLDVRRQKIWACWGLGVVVGWIGDASHQAECSDHNKDAAGVVHAIDPMVTGARAQTIVNQALAHPDDLQYVIHNRVIWSATVGWKARAYTGADPHTKHVHLSGKHGTDRRDNATCTGYNLTAQAATPVFDICPAPPKPKPKPPAPKPPTKQDHAPGSRTLQDANPNMAGDDVEFVQRFIGSAHCGAPDRSYGPKTVAGVRWYQNMRGIGVDGKVGPQTWHQMGVKA